MNAEKVQQAINSLVDSNRLNRQYPASKKAIAELTELGLIEFMPICNHPSVRAIGGTDAKKVIAAAKQDGKNSARFNAYGEGDEGGSSALYDAMNEVEEEASDEDTSDSRDYTDDDLQVFAEQEELQRLVESVTQEQQIAS